MVDAPEAPAVCLNDAVSASRRTRVDAEDSHEVRLRAGADVPAAGLNDRKERHTVLAMWRTTCVLIAVGAVMFAAPAADARILAPQTVDAGTGMDALDVGASFAAWAAFTQTTDGKNRLYAAPANNGLFGAPLLVDRGNAIIGAELAGNRNMPCRGCGGLIAGSAMAVFTEDVAGAGVLFGRTLFPRWGPSPAGGGPVLQVSADAQSASLPNAAAGLQHVRVVAMNDRGAAAVCYRDNLSASSFVAVLTPGALAWQRFGPLKVDQCMDIGIDDRANVIVVGQDNGGDLWADVVVGSSVLKSELIDADGMDEPSLALSSTGIAVVLARVNAGGGAFGAAAWRKADIASNSPWSKLGRIDEGATDFATEATEFPRGAIGASGNGIFTFRAFNPTTVTGRIYLVRLTGTTVGPAIYLASENDDAVPGIEPFNGRAYVAYTSTIWGPRVPVVHVVSPTRIGPAQQFFVPNTRPEAEIRNVVSFVGDGAGNFLALLRSGAAPVRTVAVFGDFQKPTLRPRSRSARPRAGVRTRLQSRAADTFSVLTGRDVRWRFPEHTIRGRRFRTGLNIRVRFTHAGRVLIRVAAVDRAGNRRIRFLVVHVRQPR